MPDSKNPTPGEITVMGGGLVALIGSFLDFYEVDIGTFSEGQNAWSSGLFPVATLMVIFAVIMGVLVALVRFGNLRLSDRVLGFTWEQLFLVLGFFSALYAVAWLLRSKGGFDYGIGFWLVLIGCLAAFVGALLLQRERAGTGRRGGPPTA
jgi:hypothetical protein